MSHISFTVPMKTGLGLNSREHWAVRSRRVKKERNTIAMAWLVYVGNKALCFKLPITVTLTRIKPSGKPMDSDGLQGSLKGVRDQIAKELGVDDGDTTKIRFEYGQEKGPSWGVRVEIT